MVDGPPNPTTLYSNIKFLNDFPEIIVSHKKYPETFDEKIVFKKYIETIDNQNPYDCIKREEEIDPNIIEGAILNKGNSRKDKQKLRHIRNNLKRNKGKNVVFYSHSANLEVYDEKNIIRVSRVYVHRESIGAASFDRDMRGQIYNKQFYDVDIVASHPSILYNVANENNWPCDNLKSYIDNRDSWLVEVSRFYNVDKDVAKEIFNRLCYGGKIDTWIKDYKIKVKKNKNLEFLKLFEHDVANLAHLVWDKHPVYHKIAKTSFENKKNAQRYWKNEKYTAISAFLGDLEFDLLIITSDFFEKNGYPMQAYIHDGGLLKKNPAKENFPDDLIPRALIHIKERTNYDIGLKIKKMVEIDNSNVKEELKIYGNDIIIDEDFAAEVFCDVMKDNIVYTDEQIFVYHEGIWSNKNVDVKKLVHIHKKSLVFNHMSKDDRLLTANYGGNKKTINDMLYFVSNHCSKSNFFTKNFSSGFGKLLFRDNLYYDMDTRESGTADNTIMFFDKIDRDYPIKNEDDIIYVNQKLFIDPYSRPDHGLRLKQEIALAIHGGYYNREQIVQNVGITNAGKSMHGQILKGSFDGYIDTVDFDALLEDNKKSSERAFDNMIGLFRKRINIIDEIYDNKRYDHVKIKKLASGGAPIKIRHLFQDKSVMYAALCVFFTWANHNIKTNAKAGDMAINKRLPGNLEADVRFEKNAKNNTYSKEIDYDLTEKLKTDRYLNAYLYVIMDAYTELKNNNFSVVQPDGFIDQCDTENMPFSKIFEENFEKCDDSRGISLEFIAKQLNMDKKQVKLNLQNIGCDVDVKASFRDDNLDRKMTRMWLPYYQLKEDPDEPDQLGN